MNTCQYTGIELKSKRAKNAPEVTALLDKAYKAGRYSDVSNAMFAAKRSGLIGADVLAAGQHALVHGFQVERVYEIDGEIDY